MARQRLSVVRVSKKTGLKFGLIPRGTPPSDLTKVPASKVRALGAGKTELYVAKGTKRISSATVFISARQFKQRNSPLSKDLQKPNRWNCSPRREGKIRSII